MHGRHPNNPVPGRGVQRNVEAWFAALDSFRHAPFMERGRQQPAMPAPEQLFE